MGRGSGSKPASGLSSQARSGRRGSEGHRRTGAGGVADDGRATAGAAWPTPPSAEGVLAVAEDAFGVGPVEREPGEELGRHAAAAAGVVVAARAAGPGALRLAQLGKSSDWRHTAANPPRRADVAGQELVVDGEGAGVDVADRVDQAHHPARAAQVETRAGRSP